MHTRFLCSVVTEFYLYTANNLIYFILVLLFALKTRRNTPYYTCGALKFDLKAKKEEQFYSIGRFLYLVS